MNILSKDRIIVSLISYLFLILVIILSNKLLSYEYVLSISASVMILIPILLKKDEPFFAINAKGFINGILLSALIFALYILIVYFLPLSFGNDLNFTKITFSLLFINLFLVALPEELFFRGYLQKQFGNNLYSVFIVSILFAFAHFITVCVFKGGGLFVCSVNVLTFFPSLVMGYLYLKTKTLWSSVFFHFAANIVHLIVLSG
ncbi:MAG: CPBP family glutamic-type intramembrane protease [Thermodesulfobacteriota bacterium]